MTGETSPKPLQRPALFQGIKSSKTAPPAVAPALDLAGLPPSRPMPDLDPAALEAVQERNGFTDRDTGIAEAMPREAPSPAVPRSVAPPPAGADYAALPVRLHRSNRVVPISLRATPDYHARFLSLCDQLTVAHQRKITQAELLELAIGALEREFAKQQEGRSAPV